MEPRIVNLTLLNINKQLNDFIVKHPGRTYQRDLSNPAFRQSLVDYILSRVPNRCRSSEEKNKPLISTAALRTLDQEKLQIEKLIYQGYYHLRKNEVQNNLDCKSIVVEESYFASKL